MRSVLARLCRVAAAVLMEGESCRRGTLPSLALPRIEPGSSDRPRLGLARAASHSPVVMRPCDAGVFPRAKYVCQPAHVRMLGFRV
jgi:hypothetical protein